MGRREGRKTRILLEREQGLGYFSTGEKSLETDGRFQERRFIGICTEHVRLGIGKVMLIGELDNMEEKFLYLRKGNG